MKKIIEWLYKLKADKYLHFIAGIVIAQITFALLNLVMPIIWCSFLAFIVTTIAGGIKEAIDVKYGVSNIQDFVSTMAGGFLGSLLAIPIAL